MTVTSGCSRARSAPTPGSCSARPIDAEVVEIVGDRVRFTHPLLASVTRARHRSPPSGAMRTGAWQPPSPTPSSVRGTSPSRADGPDPAVATALDRAAADASRRGAPAAAAELAGLAAELTPADAADERADRADRRRGVPPARGRARGHACPAGAARRRRCRPAAGAHERCSASAGRSRAGAAASSASRRSTKRRERPALTAAIRHVLGYVELVAGRLDRAREQAAAAVHDAQAAGDRLTYAHAAVAPLPRRLPRRPRTGRGSAGGGARARAGDRRGAAPDAAERRPGPPADVPRPLRRGARGVRGRAAARGEPRRRGDGRGRVSSTARGSSCARATGPAPPTSRAGSRGWAGRTSGTARG